MTKLLLTISSKCDTFTKINPRRMTYVTVPRLTVYQIVHRLLGRLSHKIPFELTPTMILKFVRYVGNSRSAVQY